MSHKSFFALGSSPRMRGARGAGRVDGLLDGIIPADAGSTVDMWMWIIPSEDHPRGCGEHILAAFSIVRASGSSPRMRGAHGCLTKHGQLQRIIPADAGSTRGGQAMSDPKQDHPRGCGEHIASAFCAKVGVGSSPRMRGALGDCPSE